MKTVVYNELNLLQECLYILMLAAENESLGSVMKEATARLSAPEDVLQSIAPIEELHSRVLQQADVSPEILKQYFKPVAQSDSCLASLLFPACCPDLDEAMAAYACMDSGEKRGSIIFFAQALLHLSDNDADYAPIENEEWLDRIMASGLEEEQKLNLLVACHRPDDAIAACEAVLRRAVQAYKSHAGLARPALAVAVDVMHNEFATGEAVLWKHLKLDDTHEIHCYPFVAEPNKAVLTGFTEGRCSPLVKHKMVLLYGAYLDLFSRLGSQNENEASVVESTLKTLGDKTKQQILHALKGKPLYGQELAELTGLTTATISYHMNLLLGEELVYVEKKAAKGYYHINQSVLARNIEYIRRYFGVEDIIQNPAE